MSYFIESYEIASGMTLGALSSADAYRWAGQTLSRTFDEATASHRAQYYDPVVRDDLNHLLVLGTLREIAYPFPDGQEEAPPEEPAGNFFQRHKIYTAILAYTALSMVLAFFGIRLAGGADVGGAMVLLVLGAIVIMIQNGLRGVGKAGKAISKKIHPVEINKNQLMLYGQQYWHIREYVRLAMQQQEMTPQEGLQKLCNTALAAQFPDTGDEIDANAFFFRQQLQA